MSDESPRSSLLRGALLANAAFSSLCAASLLFGADPLATWMGLGDPLPLYLVGAALVPFAAGLVLNARRPSVHLARAIAASMGDASWVLASAVLVLVWPEWFSTAGIAAIAAVAVGVAGFGLAQVAGIRRMLRNDESGHGSVIEFERLVDATPERAWRIVSDAHDYARYAPSLDFSRIVSGEGEGSVRECGDAKGSWSEVCTGWDEGREYSFEVDTEADDYPYPFRALRGRWSVVPHGRQTRVRMRFEVTMPFGVFGELMLAAILGRFQEGGERLLDNWQRAIEATPLARAA